jgi:hypothetical protein
MIEIYLVDVQAPTLKSSFAEHGTNLKYTTLGLPAFFEKCGTSTLSKPSKKKT